MSRLVMVRHGQATIQGPEYDALSPLGHEQTKRLGQFWKSQNVQFDHVFIGPRRRHRETWDQIAQELENPPQPVYLEELDEHSGQRVFLAWMKEKSPELPELKTMIREFQSGSAEAQKEFLKLFRRCTDDWVNKGFTAEGVETWPEFTARVTTGIEKVKALSGRAKTVAVISSTGPMAVCTGLALGLHETKVLELSWVLKNSAWSEFLYSGDRFSMVSFNNIAHLTDPQMATFI